MNNSSSLSLSNKITSHKQLAEYISGKRVLALNSLGKDSVLALAWLADYAKPAHIVSVFFERLAEHPGDRLYLRYLKQRFPTVEFISETNPLELNNIIKGTYQSPLDQNHVHNGFEHYYLEWKKQIQEIKAAYNCDFTCWGQSKYEGFARASLFYQKGLVQGEKIYPLGLMNKVQVWELLKSANIKLHPCYKLSQTTHDHPSYYKMRATWIANPEYRKRVLKLFPLLILDEYRWEKLLNEKA